jgi:hypothetical protein
MNEKIFVRKHNLINLKIQLKFPQTGEEMEKLYGKYNDERYGINEKQEEGKEAPGIQNNRKGRSDVKILE